ncbi:MAG: hypothetical protein H0V96_01530 [Acidimicrobiia bacterium]|nr:hypothetical protein [Acidimicrobiia bacterium]
MLAVSGSAVVVVVVAASPPHAVSSSTVARIVRRTWALPWWLDLAPSIGCRSTGGAPHSIQQQAAGARFGGSLLLAWLEGRVDLDDGRYELDGPKAP